MVGEDRNGVHTILSKHIAQVGLNTFKADKTLCQNEDCPRPLFKQFLCKQHFCHRVKKALRKGFKSLFQGPEKAYGTMDFYGRGYITEEDILASIVMSRIPFNREDVKECFRQFNMFKTLNVQSKVSNSSQGALSNTTGKPQTHQAQGMIFDYFKKNFFPQLFLINEDDSDEERKQRKNQLDISGSKQPQQTKQSRGRSEPQNLEADKEEQHNPKKEAESIITERLKKLEKILKDKFQNNWESVRKAFLALDSDYDGYITVEDILRYFGQEKDVDYNDLKKLIKDKDSKKIGKIGYTDFSKWVGNTIHQSEGFYFRHDSIKNPQFDMNNERNEINQQNKSKKLAQECLINSNLEKTVLDKIQFQWKTLRKAFMDLNMEKTGSIMPEELRFYFQHWGLSLTDEQFKYLFNKFDLDGDGKISYKDFQLTVGSEIHPAEGLYFRQDLPQTIKISSCRHDKCWQAVTGNNNYCQLHLRLHQDECLQLFTQVFKKINKKWPKFIEELKQKSDQDDQNQIFLDDFIALLKKYQVEFSSNEIDLLSGSLPGRDKGEKKRLNIGRLYDQKYNILLTKIYKSVDVHENDGQDDPVDQSGYTGQFYRKKVILQPFSEEQLVKVISQNNKLVDIIRTIKEIDKQHNGFVTTTELDDIFKINYKEELCDKNLRQIMKKYASIQNRVLVDYKLFRDSIIEQLRRLGQTSQLSGLMTAQNLTPQKTQIDLNSSMFLKDSAAKVNSQPNERDLSYRQNTLRKVQAANRTPQERYESPEKHPEKFQSVERPLLSKQVSRNNEDFGRSGSKNAHLVSKDSSGLVMIRELIRPENKEFVKYSSNRDSLLATKPKFLKSHLLNQTFVLKNQGSLLNSSEMNAYTTTVGMLSKQSKTPIQPSKLRLKKMSAFENRSLFQDHINDYSDFLIKNNDIAIDSKLIQDNLKRAQSSHGIFGRNSNSALNKTSTVVTSQNGNFQAISSLLQNMREQRRSIKTSIGMRSSSHANQPIDLDNSGNNNEIVLAQSATHDKNFRTVTNFFQRAQSFHHSRNGLDGPKNPKEVKSNEKPKTTEHLRGLHLQDLKNDQTTSNLSHTMYQTIGSSTQASHNAKFKQLMKQKLSYEWKNIYRLLVAQDKSGIGTVLMMELENIASQFGVFLTREEIKKFQQLYGKGSVPQSGLNYQQMSMDLGLHNASLNFMKNQTMRMQNVQKLRNLYSQAEKKTKASSFLYDNQVSTSHSKERTPGHTAYSNHIEFTTPNKQDNSEETPKPEVKNILLQKIKDFRDLVQLYQRKNHQEESIIPLGQFKTILKTVGINLTNQSLLRFLVNKQVSDLANQPMNSGSRDRAKSSHSFSRNLGVNGSGIDAREFLKYYI